MEKFDIYRADKSKTGQTGIRGVKLEDGQYRFVVRVIIFNQAADKVLIQKRTASKSTWPSRWDYAAAGGVLAGESLQTAAQRELFEELGIDVDFSNQASRMTISFDEGWDEIFMIQKDIELENLALQTSEVAEVRWVNEAELLELDKTGSFIPFSFNHSIFNYIKFSGEARVEDWG